MFKFEKTGDERRDCTTPYRVILDKEYTVKEFITTVMINYANEWGYIGIKSDRDVWFGDPHIEYSHGKILRVASITGIDFPLEAKVLSVKAEGGWSRMDYILIIQTDENK